MVAAGDRVLVWDENPLVFAARSGERQWSGPAKADEFVVSAGTVYWPVEPPTEGAGPTVAATALADGTVRERYALGSSEGRTAVAEVILVGEYLYVLTLRDGTILLDVIDVRAGVRLTGPDKRFDRLEIPRTWGFVVSHGALLATRRDGENENRILVFN